MRVNRRDIGILATGAALAGLGMAGPATPSAAAAAEPLPNACALLPASVIATATGQQPGGLHPHETSYEADGSSGHRCDYQHGRLKLSVSVTPSAADAGGYGGLPGLVIVKEPSLGAR
jgi:hypothetical protein